MRASNTLASAFVMVGVLAGTGTAYGELTYIQYPGANSTWVQGIDGNNVVGGTNYGSVSGGFVYDLTTGTYSNFTQVGQHVYGISGNSVVGYQYDASGTRSFVYDLTTGTQTSFSALNFTHTFAYGIDGSIVVGGGSGWSGFVYDLTTGNTTYLSMPGGGYTEAHGIDGNRVVGYYNNANGVGGSGFVYDLTTREYRSFSFPGASTTVAYDIDGDNIVGGYKPDASVEQWAPFLYNLETATWASMNVLGGHTYARGISGNNVLVGHNSANYGGFVAELSDFVITHSVPAIPAPGAALLAVIGFSLVGWVKRQWRL